MLASCARYCEIVFENEEEEVTMEEKEREKDEDKQEKGKEKGKKERDWNEEEVRTLSPPSFPPLAHSQRQSHNSAHTTLAKYKIRRNSDITAAV